MAYKWIQCSVCCSTKPISAFPSEEHKALKKSPSGICGNCRERSDVRPTLLTSIYANPFVQYLAEITK